MQKTKADDAVKKLTEARTRYVEVTQYKSNEFEKYKSIESDFIHQNGLMTKLSQEKIQELDSKIDERKQKIDESLENCEFSNKLLPFQSVFFTPLFYNVFIFLISKFIPLL